MMQTLPMQVRLKCFKSEQVPCDFVRKSLMCQVQADSKMTVSKDDVLK